MSDVVKGVSGLVNSQMCGDSEAEEHRSSVPPPLPCPMNLFYLAVSELYPLNKAVIIKIGLS